MGGYNCGIHPYKAKLDSRLRGNDETSNLIFSYRGVMDSLLDRHRISNDPHSSQGVDFLEIKEKFSFFFEYH